MATITTYPGVYVQENDTSSVLVKHNATAVPVFVMGDNDPLCVARMLFVTSWFHYVSHVKKITGVDIDLENNQRDINTKAYFECGGGVCYFCACDHGNDLIPQYDDITIVVPFPGVEYKDGWTNINQLCQPGTGRFAIVNGPHSQLNYDYNPAEIHSANPCAAIYYPYLTAAWTTGIVSPSAVMAGVYCANDRQYGVWSAPANISLPASYRPCYTVSDALQGKFNGELAINMIRTFPNRGTVVWGGRTLENSDNWRYISVRRLFDSVERDIKNMMAYMVFEPNVQPTWIKLSNAITNYLYKLWQQGALQGNTEKEAFQVQIGKGSTMNDDNINQGEMLVKVALAPVKPAEFIVLEFTQGLKN